jgi:hypothetical protein
MIGLGQRVRIARANKNDCFPKPVVKDEDGYDVETGTYIGQVGEVVRREFGSGSFPVGESPTDPLYVVKTPVGTDAFWSEEIEVVK